jgi:hypothetical protein
MNYYRQPSGQKLILFLLAIITLEVVPFRASAPFPVLLPLFKCILEFLFCEGVQHGLWFCLDHLSCVKMAAFQLGKQRIVRWVGVDSHVVFGQKYPGEKGSMRLYCRDATASPFVTKFQGEVFIHFHAVAVKRHSSIRNWLFGLPGGILCEQSPWCQRKRWACTLDFTLHLACCSNTHVWLMLSFLNTCLIIARVTISLFPRFARNLMHAHCRFHRQITSGHTHSKWKDIKKSACPNRYMKFLHHTTTTVVQMAAPVPEIMDTPSYFYIIFFSVIIKHLTYLSHDVPQFPFITLMPD